MEVLQAKVILKMSSKIKIDLLEEKMLKTLQR